MMSFLRACSISGSQVEPIVHQDNLHALRTGQHWPLAFSPKNRRMALSMRCSSFSAPDKPLHALSRKLSTSPSSNGIFSPLSRAAIFWKATPALLPLSSTRGVPRFVETTTSSLSGTTPRSGTASNDMMSPVGHHITLLHHPMIQSVDDEVDVREQVSFQQADDTIGVTDGRDLGKWSPPRPWKPRRCRSGNPVRFRQGSR